MAAAQLAYLTKQFNLKQSIQNNTPYSGSGSLQRSGETRQMAMLKGGFSPLLLAPFVPIIHELIKRPVNKLFDKLGLGSGAIMRSGGAKASQFQPGSIGVHMQPMNTGLHQKPHHDMRNSSMGGSEAESLSKYELKNLKVLEKKLAHLAGKPDEFMKKLTAIQAKGQAYFNKYRKMKKYKKSGKKVFRFSKRYKTLKLKHYTKYPKTTFGVYRKSDKYKKHKAKYIQHRKKKATL